MPQKQSNKPSLQTILRSKYNNLIKTQYSNDHLSALKNFETISEEHLRNTLAHHYSNQRSMDQAWKAYKGKLYEYAVYTCINHIIKQHPILNRRYELLESSNLAPTYQKQIIIRNWSDIFPDVDLLLVDKSIQKVKAILSCKTSLRERLTETAFWRRELEKNNNSDIKVIFITTDKDKELKIETNRYILLHIVDCTFVTNPDRYDELINTYKEKYGMRNDFEILLNKVKPIDEIKRFINELE